MAINTSWTVKIGTVASPTDFTNRVMGMQIDQQVDVNVIGRGVCRITLLNKDGALTPGGGGIYGTTDWFAQGVFVACLTNTGGADTTHQVFHGIVTDFDLQDDSVFSTVTITAQDALIVAGRTPIQTFGSFSGDYDFYLDTFLSTAYLNYPLLGKTTFDVALDYEWVGSATGDWIRTATSVVPATLADLLQTSTIPSMNDVMWPTTITASGTNVVYGFTSLGQDNVRNAMNQTDFEFDPPSSLSGSKLPFENNSFQQAFNNDDLITTATIKGTFVGATEAQTNSSTISSYGARTVAFTNTFVYDQTETNRMATKLVNRYGNTKYTPVSLTITASMVKQLAADAAVTKWQHLLDIRKGLWQRVKITWTGSGATSQTAYCVIKGRSISVTPADTRVTLSLGNWADNHAFILNTDQLNIDKLG